MGDRGSRDWYQLERWRRLARAQKQNYPLCRMCEANGFAVAATIADHIHPHNGDWDAFILGELQSLCAPCHSSRKQAIEKRGYDSQIDQDGWPTDPRHPANRASRRVVGNR